MTTSTTQAGQSGNRDSVAPTVTERVAAGVALLDKQRPGWDQAIDLDTLHISSCTRCVLGQLYGDVSKGYEQYGIEDEDAGQFGFDQIDRGEYGLLTAEWKRVIHARRGAVS